MQDSYDGTRERVTGMPGYLHSQSTLKSTSFVTGATETWVVETVRLLEADDKGRQKSKFWTFLERNSADGGQRIVIPPGVMETMYRQRESCISKANRGRGRQAAETARGKALAQAQAIVGGDGEGEGDKPTTPLITILAPSLRSDK